MTLPEILGLPDVIIPLVIEAKKRHYNNTFIIRSNYKNYANPLKQDSLKILKTYIKKYNISIEYSDQIKINEIKGIIFMVDGDIYGPPRKKGLDESLLFKLSFSFISLIIKLYLLFIQLYLPDI